MQSLNPIRAISFDIGGTLIEPWPSVGHVYAAVAGEHGHGHVSPEQLNRQFADAWRRKAGFDHSRAAWQALVQATFEGLLEAGEAAALLDDLYERFARKTAWRVFDDVFPTLLELKARGLRLAVTSNWDERLRPLLEDLQLAPFFDALVVSIEVGEAKPSIGIFQRCASALGLPVAAILHVGDSPAEDCLGARQAGMGAMGIDRRRRLPGENTLAHLGELLSRLPIGSGVADKCG